jgi:hypothetical protein
MLKTSYNGHTSTPTEDSIVRIAPFTPFFSTSVVEANPKQGGAYGKDEAQACSQDISSQADGAVSERGCVVHNLRKQERQYGGGHRAGSAGARPQLFSNPLIESKLREGGQTPTLDEILCAIVARLAGVSFVGLMEGARNKQLVLFIAPGTGSTLALPLNDFHVGRIQSHVKASNRKFGVTND